jgi:hypothetical protein
MSPGMTSRGTRLLALFVLCVAGTAGAAVAAGGKEPKKAIKPAVQARAKRIAVGLRDLPGFGWKAQPSQSDRSSPRCSYYRPDQSRLTENGDYTSPDFTRSDGLYVSSSVDIFVSAKQARQAFALVVRPELPRCLGESVVKSGQPGHITLRSVGPLAFPRLGDRSTAYRVVFAVKNGNQQVPATIDLVAVNRGAVDVAVFFSSAGQPVPASFERAIAKAVAARMT